jgi:alkanesulfonate monooxygenase SsuD/methylene tetrahydromethanopterin reductase-like flavin-dependent oxidoreductase (luciferase family)
MSAFIDDEEHIRVDIGIGLDFTLGLSYEEQAQISAESARLGYTNIWTPEGAGEDSFQLCAARWAATKDIVPGGVTTGIAVSPVAQRTPIGFAMSAGTVSAQTGGKFILGIGSGGAYTADYRRQWGVRETSSMQLMRDYVTTVRALVRGEKVTYESKQFRYQGVSLGIQPAPMTPVYLAALGPEMLRLAGEAADGVSLNWCSDDMVAWSRELVNEGAVKAGRDPSEVKLAEYIRICVDDDEAVARRSYTRAVMGYALGRAGAKKPMGYRAHFERMGFAEDLKKIDAMRDAKAPQDEVLDAFPEKLLRHVGYYGKAEGAAAAFSKLARGLDCAIVRVVAARPGIAATRAVMEACKPELVTSN